MIFDTHAHYDDQAFEADRDALLAGFPARGIGAVVNVAADYASLATTGELTARYPHVYGAYGIHPSELDTVPGVAIAPDPSRECGAAEGHGDCAAEEQGSGARIEAAVRMQENIPVAFLETLRDLCRDQSAVAVGEIGLDYHWHKENKAQQIAWFLAQIEQARQLQKPVIIHSREAAKDTLAVAKHAKLGDVGGVMHCYAYSVEHAREYLGMGIFLGIGGVLTFKNAKKLREVVAYAPLDALVLETDCPYLAPTPHRGERNDSGYLPLVISAIAQIKGISEEEVERATWENARRLYRFFQS